MSAQPGWPATVAEVGAPARSHASVVTTRRGAPGGAGRLIARTRGALRGREPLLLVLAVVAFNLVGLAPELHRVANLNDSAMHSEMVRYAAGQLRAGRLPWTSWFPYLGLGSPHFLHYQSLGATMTGLLGLVIGANHAFSWSLYLLLATWPISIYLAARLFGLERWVGACAAACSPFVVSVLGIGYEQVSYLFVGYGLWSQLWAMWTLPLCWAASFRAVREGRYRVLATVLIAATCSLHFMTGYLAFLVVPLFAVLTKKDLGRNLARAGVLLVSGGLAASWVVYPLLHFRAFASINESLATGPDANSYGAPTVLHWLVTGQLLDAHRLPVLTVLAGAGLIWCVLHWRSHVLARALPVATAASLVLFFGRPTLGPLEKLLPGHQDLFMRRFLMGVQLGMIFLAGIGFVALAAFARGGIARLRRQELAAPRPWRGALAALLGVGLVLFPAWAYVAGTDLNNSRYITAQQTADATQGAEVAQLVAISRRLGGGRIYAGTPSNWGLDFSVGAVPVFRYLAYLDVDEVGFTLRTASLMTNPEVDFDESSPGDYRVFGVRFLILPSQMASPVSARRVAERGAYSLWSVGSGRYISVEDSIGPALVANRGDLGAQSLGYLDSVLPDEARTMPVAFQGLPAAKPTWTSVAPPATAPGRVTAERDQPTLGRFAATVHLRRRAVVVLSASYDPGWHATLDGRPAKTEMLAPAVVGVVVPRGTHLVVFAYHGYGKYPLLWGAGIVGLLFAWVGGGYLERVLRRRDDGGPPAGGSGEG